MTKRLLLAAIAIAFAWLEPALVQQHIQPRQLVEHIGALALETYDVTTQRFAFAAAVRCNGPQAHNLRES